VNALLAARSLLFVPGHQPERYGKALASGADAVIVDLEDAVPAADKGTATQALRDAWPRLDAARVLIRINARGTRWHHDDLMLCAQIRPAAVVVPKAEHPDHLLEAALHARCGEHGLLALIESAAGFARVRDIAACPAVGRLLLGHIDLQADLGMRCDADEHELDAVRFELVLASRLAGLPAPVDGVTVATDDAQRLRADALRAQRFGFGGKLCIHPRQIAPLHEALAPTAQQLAWARRVIEAARAAGGGAVRVDGEMVDRPVVLLAERLLSNRPGDKR
jgi:citrate lyase subunit beta/citryl-CoA lyase